jgi:hypothetical protein
LREVTPLPLFIKDFEKAVSFTKQGFKTLVLLGGMAAEAFLGYGGNVTRWRGHYEVLTQGVGNWYSSLVSHLTSKLGKGKKKEKKAGKSKFIDQAVVGGIEDVLETPSLPSPKFKRPRRKRCKTCGVLGGHTESCSERVVEVR